MLEPVAAPRPTRWLGLGVVLLAQVLDLLDALVTTIAGPTIMRDLHGDATLIQWLSAGYTIAMAAGILVGGRMGDLYGRKRMLLIGMTGFILLSLACALAQTPEQMILFRIVQGLFGALMVPQGFGLLRELFPPQQANNTMAAFGPVIALTSIGGPMLAGWLLRANFFDLSWRMIFFINVPLGIAALLMGLRALPHHISHPEGKLDLPGMLVAASAMGLLIYPLIQGRDLNWPWWVFALEGGAVLTFGLFVWLESSRDRAQRSTLVVPSLFRKPAFNAGLFSGMTIFASMIGLSIALTVFTQIGLGFESLKAGLAGVPQALGLVVGFGIAQHGAARKRAIRPLMQTGIGVAIAGMAVFAAIIGWQQANTTIVWMAPGLLLIGIGMGLTTAPFFELVLSGVNFREIGTASGALTASQQIGSSVGIALLGTIAFQVLKNLKSTPTIHDFTHATQWAVLAAMGLAFVSFLFSLKLPRNPVHKGTAVPDHSS